MPSFYQQTMSGHPPLTPPEFIPGHEAHGCRPAQYAQDPYMSQQAMPPRLDSVVDYPSQYPPPSSQGMAYDRTSLYANGQTLPPISRYYLPIGVPILPPLRAQNDQYNAQDYRMAMQQSQVNDLAQQQAQQQQPQQDPKEEKATGGVSAKLDYEMERMTDFVSEAAQGMYALHLSGICLADIDICRSIQPGMPVQPAFRKWVSQVLSATRLPSATILLSLHYLTVRMKNFRATVGNSENQIYRLLAVSMILGSKFLDDNTFINRSWSDVSGIKVTELNHMEIDWLALIGFDLHADPDDAHGVAMWMRAWKEYDAHMTAKARSAKLSPLDTNLPRQTSARVDSGYLSSFSKVAYGSFTPQSSSSFISADPWNRQESMQSDYYGSQQRQYDHSNRFGHDRNSTSYNRQALPPLQSFAPSYYSPWNQTPRSGSHGYGCNCLMCARPYNSYSMSGGYPAQTVVG